MKSLLTILAVFIFGSAFAQPQPYSLPYQNLGGPNIAVRDTGALMVRQTFVVPQYTDTAAANLSPAKFYSSSVIFTTDSSFYWGRNKFATGWLKFGSTAPSSSQNISNASLRWNGEYVQHVANFGITFDSVGIFSALSRGNASADSASIVLDNFDDLSAKLQYFSGGAFSQAIAAPTQATILHSNSGLLSQFDAAANGKAAILADDSLYIRKNNTQYTNTTSDTTNYKPLALSATGGVAKMNSWVSSLPMGGGSYLVSTGGVNLTDTIVTIFAPINYVVDGVRQEPIQSNGVFNIPSLPAGYQQFTIIAITDGDILDTLRGIIDTANAVPPALPAGWIFVQSVFTEGPVVSLGVTGGSSALAWSPLGNIIGSNPNYLGSTDGRSVRLIAAGQVVAQLDSTQRLRVFKELLMSPVAAGNSQGSNTLRFQSSGSTGTPFYATVSLESFGGIPTLSALKIISPGYTVVQSSQGLLELAGASPSIRGQTSLTLYNTSATLGIAMGNNYYMTNPASPLFRVYGTSQYGNGKLKEIMLPNGQTIWSDSAAVNMISPSALAEWRSTTQGILLPRMTGAQMNAIVSPATNMLVICTDSTSSPFCYYNGSAWVKIGGSSGGSGSAYTLQQSFDAAPVADPQINAHGNVLTVDSVGSFSFFKNYNSDQSSTATYGFEDGAFLANYNSPISTSQFYAGAGVNFAVTNNSTSRTRQFQVSKDGVLFIGLDYSNQPTQRMMVVDTLSGNVSYQIIPTGGGSSGDSIFFDAGLLVVGDTVKLDTASLTTFGGITPEDYAIFLGSAQWAMSGSDIYNTNSGNVGIGTASPTAALHVIGDAIIDGNGAEEIEIINAEEIKIEALEELELKAGVDSVGSYIYLYNDSATLWSSFEDNASNLKLFNGQFELWSGNPKTADSNNAYILGANGSIQLYSSNHPNDGMSSFVQVNDSYISFKIGEDAAAPEITIDRGASIMRLTNGVKTINTIEPDKIGTTFNWFFDGGKVGVGVEVPNEKFEVDGNIKITGVYKLTPYTVATLPAGNEGDYARVTDALAPTYGATVVGGGAVGTPVFFTAGAWTVH